jgi:Fic family protein
MVKFKYANLKSLGADAEILALVAQIREAKGRMGAFSPPRAGLEKLLNMAKIESVESSNKIEGIQTTANRLADLCAHSAKPQNRDEAEIMGYRDVLNTVHENFEHIPLRVNLILQMHRDLFKYSGAPNTGKFKSVNNYITQTNPNGEKFVRFTPLDAFATPTAVESACAEYEKALNIDGVEPLLLIPVFILDFLCIHPFIDGNGRLSRLLTLLLLYQNGFTVGKYISIEKIIEKTKDNYYSSLAQSSHGWLENKNDANAFVKYMLGVILAAYRDFGSRVLDAAKSKSNQIRALFETHIGKLTKAEIKKLLPGVSLAMIEKTLKGLLNSNFVKMVDMGKNTGYVKS